MNKLGIVLGLIAVVSWFFWSTAGFLISDTPVFSDVNAWLIPVLTFVLLISLLSLSFLLLNKKWEKMLCSTVVFLTFLIQFGYNKLYLAAFILMFLLQYISIKRFETELQDRLKINLGTSIRRAAPYIVTSLLIMVSFAYFLSSDIQLSATKNELPLSVEKITKSVVSYFFTDQGITDPRLQEQAETEVIGKLNNFLSPYYKFLPPILAFSMFLILQGFSFIFLWLSIALSLLLFLILKKGGIVKVETVQKEAEIIRF